VAAILSVKALHRGVIVTIV